MTNTQYWYSAEVISNYDGDTITLNIDMGCRIYTINSIRLYRINTPELSQPGGKEARDFLSILLPPKSKVRIRTFKNKEDKYGRWLGEIYIEDICLNDRLVQLGYAVYKEY